MFIPKLNRWSAWRFTRFWNAPGDSIAQWKLTRPPCALFNRIVMTVELPRYAQMKKGRPKAAPSLRGRRSSEFASIITRAGLPLAWRARSPRHTAQGLGEPARSRYMAWTIASSLQRRVDWASRPSASSCRILQSDIFNPLSGNAIVASFKDVAKCIQARPEKSPAESEGLGGRVVIEITALREVLC